MSAKKAKIQANQTQIKKELIEEYGSYCMLGNHYSDNIQLVHIIRQSYSLELQDDKRNCVLGCHNHHTIFDDGSIEEVMKLKGITPILERMKELDEHYYNRYAFRSLQN